MRYCLALDLKDDAVLIARYEEHHQRIWPEIAAHLNQHGVIGMQIFRLGTRMTMIMETDDTRYDAAAMVRAAEQNSRVQEWEALMWQFQAPTPWTPQGQKWTPMTLVFDLQHVA
ncbi:L-rhamnose mutarotase [Herbaspirillum sp. Sphag1AN]|uniref:L-rhamnose mutarotase n=1 Tax=unclassified Herbaspirillum TaxID=2624150 RepID=UPI00160A041B|nr:MULTISPECIES: L-rhamnose mutarotase [unclassified Herbaspirillum]MBB3212951.1 L-rhamnose mutarotase [Herbaspirillum sp. Sphag1AN]MBB3246148.1 L-rhamnose mutarotase [Herbaspirillum sp. Sphag64]